MQYSLSPYAMETRLKNPHKPVTHLDEVLVLSLDVLQVNPGFEVKDDVFQTVTQVYSKKKNPSGHNELRLVFRMLYNCAKGELW